MSSGKLLQIEPPELKFRLELNMRSSCTVQLFNSSRHHVAFKVMATHPAKYTVQPNIGVLFPGSICIVKVTMHGLTEAPPDMNCRHKFLIKSASASRGTTIEDARRLFTTGREVEECRLRVVYIHPSQNSNSDHSQVRLGQERNQSDSVDLLVRIIIIGLLVFMIWYKILPLIWSIGVMIVMLVLKMINRVVSDSMEDWVVKSLVYVCIHFFTYLFQRI